MNIQSYPDLIRAADMQPEPQRLLFVFAAAELPDGATAEQISQFEQGEGGALTPVLCVDKLPAEVADFHVLVAESEQTGLHWDIAFVSAMSGRGGMQPNSDEAEQPLKMMMEQIQAGMVAQFLALSRDGQIIQLY
ncbi:ribonucleotide reductase subunit alpha [Halopseudomonas sp.]|uniref:ribonucleotide reductase subunit alpha n=1 Tax=Halopseudomonas sp. TaxID=2901191 RepID=UPI003566CC68